MPTCLKSFPRRQNENIRPVPGLFAAVSVQPNIDLRFEREIDGYERTLVSNSNSPDSGTVKIRPEVSQKKLIANRQNALRSTGPRTARGKAAACRNALRHGILSRTIDFPPDAVNSALSSMSNTEASTFYGKQMLEGTAQIWWKLARVVTLENHSVFQGSDALKLAPWLIFRYETMLVRQLHARIREFTARRTETRGNV